MKRVEDRSTWKGAWASRWAAVAALLLLGGCSAVKPDFERSLMADRGRAQREHGVAERYTVTCPDVLEVEFSQSPALSGPHPIGVDGRLDWLPIGRPRVEGLTPDEIAVQLAEMADVPPAQVRVRVVEHRSQCLYLFGEVMGSQRAVPYQGQETVVDMLRRIGGITPGAAPRDVFVVRNHIAECARPEVFHVDLEAIVLRHDERTNVRLQPSDQIHVGGTRRAGLEKCVPPWLRPLYQKLCEWLPVLENKP